MKLLLIFGFSKCAFAFHSLPKCKKLVSFPFAAVESSPLRYDVVQARSNLLALSAGGFNTKTLIPEFDGNDGGNKNEGWMGGGDDAYEVVPFRTGNSTLIVEGDLSKEKLPSRLKKSPLLAFVYRFGIGVWRKTMIYSTMALYILGVAKKHILPIYMATSIAQLLKPSWLHNILRFTLRSFFVLSLSSFATQALRSKVNPLVPPISRNNTSRSKQPSSAPFAVICGASSNIGRATAKELALKGWNLILIGSNKSTLQELGKKIRSELKNRGRELHFHAIEANFTMSSMPNSVYNEVNELKIEPEILINAAESDCITTNSPSLETFEDITNKILTVDCLAATQLTQLFASDMKKRNCGRIMIVSNTSAMMPSPIMSVCSAMNSYLSTFSQALSVELEPYGVGVTCLMTGKINPSRDKESKEHKKLPFCLPSATISVEEIVRQGVQAMLMADPIVVPGWANKLYTHVLYPLLPHRVGMLISKYTP